MSSSRVSSAGQVYLRSRIVRYRTLVISFTDIIIARAHFTLHTHKFFLSAAVVEVRSRGRDEDDDDFVARGPSESAWLHFRVAWFVYLSRSLACALCSDELTTRRLLVVGACVCVCVRVCVCVCVCVLLGLFWLRSCCRRPYIEIHSCVERKYALSTLSSAVETRVDESRECRDHRERRKRVQSKVGCCVRQMAAKVSLSRVEEVFGNDDNELVRTTLVSGEPELGKAFLFEAAISWAKEAQQVHYFTSKQLESLPPVFHDRSEPSANALKNITFIYTHTYEDLIVQLVRLQTFQKPPSILLVDELDTFSDYRNIRNSSRELHAARCCAVLLNAAHSCARVICTPVHVCATSSSKDQGRLATYGKYFDNCWNISSEEGESEMSASVWMRRDDGKKAMEFKRLDDPVFVLKRVFGYQENEEEQEI